MNLTPEQYSKLSPAQRAALEKADASMKPALDLYAARCSLWRLSCRLPLRDLVRLNQLLSKLSDDDLRQIAAYAEGLAEWNALEQTCAGAPELQEERTTSEGSPG